MEVLDIAAQADRDFDIHGGFKAHWRSHVWEGTVYMLIRSHFTLKANKKARAWGTSEPCGIQAPPFVPPPGREFSEFGTFNS